MTKLAARHAQWVMPLFLSLFMTCVVSGISTLRVLGWGPAFLGVWFASWMWSWLVAFPAVLVVLPLVKRLTAALVDVRPPA